MSIFAPIDGAPDPNVLRALFAGGTSLAATPTQLVQLSATFVGGTALTAAQPGQSRFLNATLTGGTALTAAPKLAISAAANFVGATALTATLRFAGEPSQFASAEFIGDTQLLVAEASLLKNLAAQFVGATELTATAEITEGADFDFGFTFFVDILDTALAAAAALTHTRYSARLKANGVEVPITAFTVRAPRDTLGLALSVTLAKPDPALVQSSASLTFELGVWDGSAFQWLTLITGGRLAGRDQSIGLADSRPTDTVQITTLDVLGDRWTLAPRRPTTFHDPDKVAADTLAPDSQSAIRDEAGVAIQPLNVSVPNLKLSRALREAYVVGCGFASVVTNIPDYRIPRADFSLAGGWHEGARALVALYEPLYFPGDGNSLWITDPDNLNLAGLQPPLLPLSSVVTVRETLPPRQVVNSLVVSYQETEVVTAGEFASAERLEQESSESGVYGTSGFTETSVTRRYRQYQNSAEPGVITRETLLSATTTVHDHNGELIHREVQQDQLDGLQRKTGHTRTVESRVPNLAVTDAPLALLTVLEEKCSITYRPHPTEPHSFVQDNSTTLVSGLIHEDNDNQYRAAPFRLPITDAHRNGFIDAKANQATSYGAIKTTIEALRVRPDGEIDVSVVVIDHLANTTERSSATPRVGSVAVSTRRQRIRRVLLTVPGTTADGRRAVEFSAGDLPRARALALGRRKLSRLNNPRRDVAIKLPAVNLGLRRGSLVRTQTRGGAVSGTFIVAGYQIEGRNLGTAARKIEMSLDGVEAGTS